MREGGVDAGRGLATPPPPTDVYLIIKRLLFPRSRAPSVCGGGVGGGLGGGG